MSIFAKAVEVPPPANLPSPIRGTGIASAMPRVPEGALDDMLVFAVAARQRSMDKAAGALNVPVSRVRDQIARLEATIGAALWEGRGDAFQPTATGAELADTLASHLRPIAQSLNRARLAAQPLVIACEDEDLAEALLRALPTTAKGVGPVRLMDGPWRERADLTIGWAPQATGAGEWFDLFAEQRCAVAAPALAATCGDAGADEIARLPLLVCGPADEGAWRDFLTPSEPDRAVPKDLAFRPCASAADLRAAALEGSGVALVDMTLARADRLAGRLTQVSRRTAWTKRTARAFLPDATPNWDRADDLIEALLSSFQRSA
ncbi:MAG: LysR family transcriptional regulator [Shimia sp.]